MTNKKSLEALNRTMKDLKGNDKIFGNGIILLSGDFRQTLLIIPRSTPADEINACLKSSHLWKYVTKIQLTTNMRVNVQQEKFANKFASERLDIGEGKIKMNPKTNEISFECDFC